MQKQKNMIQEILLISIAVVIGAQVNMNLFNSDFKISIGILVIPILIVMVGKYPLLPVTFVSAFGVLASRVFIFWIQHGSIHLQGYFPETIFYLIYGLCVYFYCYSNDYKISAYSIPCLFVFDYTSNLVELFVRSPNLSYTLSQAQLPILLVAFSRTLILWLILYCLDYYKFSLLKKEHADRYQRLLLLISRLHGEVVLLKKNSAMMEDTMQKAYHLYQVLQEEDVNPLLSQEALHVARDVHELKKEYALILRGLSDVTEKVLKDEGMYVLEILMILKQSISASLTSQKKLILNIDMTNQLFTDKPYLLMSVFRNLFVNAVEASDKKEIQIDFIQTFSETHYIFQITDNGSGIDPEDLDQIFSAGFSTKINYETGEINRGLGLNLVKELIQMHWNGEIRVNSIPGRTTFTITIPKADWSDIS